MMEKTFLERKRAGVASKCGPSAHFQTGAQHGLAAPAAETRQVVE